MKRNFAIALLALLLSCGVFAAPHAFAQESTAAPPVVTESPTPEPPPVEMPEPIPGTDYSLVQIVIIVLAASFVAVSAIFGTALILMARNAVNTLPKWAVDLLRQNATPLLDQVDKVFDVPGTDLDDIARARLRAVVNEILADNEARKAK